MKRTAEEQYVYNERCISYLTILIKSSMSVRSQTPTQAERVFRWRMARRALEHDQIALRQGLSDNKQLHLAGWMDDARDAQAWFFRQLHAWMKERNDNRCLEGVEAELTPLAEG